MLFFNNIIILFNFTIYLLVGIGENGERLSLRQHSQRLVLKSTPGEEASIDLKDNISVVEDNRRESKTAGKAIANKKGPPPPKKEVKSKSKDRAPRTKTDTALMNASSKKKLDQDRKKIGIIQQYQYY